MKNNFSIHKILFFAICICLMDLPIAQAQVFNHLRIPGHAEQGSIVYGNTSPDARVFVGVDEVKVTPNGDFVFGIHQEAPPVLTIVSVDTNGMELKQVIKVLSVDWNIQQIEGIADNMVSPSQTENTWIEKDSAAIKKARAIYTTDNFPTCFIMPVEGEITGSFGSRRFFNGEEKSPHTGIDIAADEGTPIKATADGIISHTNENSFYNGKLIIIDHGYGISSAYAHLSHIGVQVGDKVKASDEIGKVGSTGRSTGPHLHFGLNWEATPLDSEKAIMLTKNNCKQ